MQIIRDILAETNEFVGELHGRKMRNSDRIIFNDALRVFVDAVTGVFPLQVDGVYTYPTSKLAQLKCAYFDFSRLRLKYLLKDHEKIWGKYICYDNLISGCIDIKKYSQLRGKAVGALKRSVGFSDSDKEKNYDILKTSIKHMSDLQECINDTRIDCRMKIRKATAKSVRKGIFMVIVWLLGVAVIPLLCLISWAEVPNTGIGRGAAAVKSWWQLRCSSNR